MEAEACVFKRAIYNIATIFLNIKSKTPKLVLLKSARKRAKADASSTVPKAS